MANEIYDTLEKDNIYEINKFKNKDTSFIVFNHINEKNTQYNKKIPDFLPSPEELENDLECLRLASSNQILLHLVEQSSFAYDIDNHGKIMRLVANFKGGGANKLATERPENVDKSSHSGIALGAHTEAPYHCTTSSEDGHSPAPSSLILTAKFNPLSEPTTIIPIAPILNKLNFEEILALTTKNFDFTRSETFTDGKGAEGKNTSILDIDKMGRFSMKYNSYRFTVNPNAPLFVKKAFKNFELFVNEAKMIKVSLSPNKTIIINNNTSLHCRDVIKDNRRLLIRLFGYSSDINPIILREQPLLIQG
ncbi:conserved protein of unknown function [Xenorhabdus poinarii G6]|uniref:TauD/TfdA-like domain-containing protein n=1 Tax=Xenorhabdus poinarii G6 TaxID=1354304 RepID=A0A068R6Z2_9GAMM|nr:hypothetical protein [Xenorhabdus poinarii]CDG22734.1 conserved protein of unknown function [Xenorhabdus poinarii G6]